MTTPLISVVIPMLDAERTLERCLGALDAQTMSAGRFEVLLVDNGCSDRSVETAQGHPAVRLLAEPRRGSYNARNLGIRESRGEVVAFLDPDCEPVPGWLEAIERTFTDSSVILACGIRRPAEGSSLLRAIGEYEMVKDEIVLGGRDPEIVYGYTSNMAVRAAVFAEIGCFVDLARGADTLFVREVARRRGMDTIRFVPEMEVVHHELDSLAVYYRKVFLYAQNRERNNAILASRPLSGAERMRIFGEVVRRGRYSPVRAAMLLAALGAGSIAWRAGRLAHRFGAAPSLPTSPTGPSGDPQGRK